MPQILSLTQTIQRPSHQLLYSLKYFFRPALHLLMAARLLLETNIRQ